MRDAGCGMRDAELLPRRPARTAHPPIPHPASHPASNPSRPTGILSLPEMKMSAVVSDTIGQYPSTTGEEKAATLESIRRAQAGDVAPMETLYREHSARSFALCVRLKAGDRTDATELMQHVFVRALRRLWAS